jgi:hypothetical protein
LDGRCGGALCDHLWNRWQLACGWCANVLRGKMLRSVVLRHHGVLVAWCDRGGHSVLLCSQLVLNLGGPSEYRIGLSTTTVDQLRNLSSNRRYCRHRRGT